MENKEEIYNLNIAVVGDQSVGKTSILLKYLNKDDKELKTTLGIDYLSYETSFNGKKININFLDTSGQERFYCITSNHYNEADGFIIVFDLNDEVSFDNILFWFNAIKNKKNIKDIDILMIGNKNDLERKVSLSRIDNFEKKNKNELEINYIFHETSAITGDGIEDSMNILIEKMVKHYDENKKNNIIKPKGVKLKKEENNKENNKENKDNNKKKRKCCLIF